MTVYLDTSVVVPVFVAEALSVRVEAFLRGLASTPILSDLAAAEFAAALSTALRARRVTEAGARDRLSDFDHWRATSVQRVAFVSDDMENAEAHVRRFEPALRVPDALHLAVAQRISATLVTLDRRLADAAGALGIRVTVPG